MSMLKITETPELARHLTLVYAVSVSISDVRSENRYFETWEDATAWCVDNPKCGWYGGFPGKPKEVFRIVLDGCVLETTEARYFEIDLELKNKTAEQFRKDALAKLSPAERKVLGL